MLLKREVQDCNVQNPNNGPIERAHETWFRIVNKDQCTCASKPYVTFVLHLLCFRLNQFTCRYNFQLIKFLKSC